MSTTIERQVATTATVAQTITLGSFLKSHRGNFGPSAQALTSTTGFSETVIRSVDAGCHDLDLDSLARLIEAYKSLTLMGSGRWVGSTNSTDRHNLVLLTGLLWYALRSAQRLSKSGKMHTSFA